jgi:hypothetical protein
MFGLRVYRATFFPTTMAPCLADRMQELLAEKRSIAAAILDPPAEPEPAPSAGIDQWSLVQRRGPMLSRVLRTWPA